MYRTPYFSVIKILWCKLHTLRLEKTTCVKNTTLIWRLLLKNSVFYTLFFFKFSPQVLSICDLYVALSLSILSPSALWLPDQLLQPRFPIISILRVTLPSSLTIVEVIAVASFSTSAAYYSSAVVEIKEAVELRLQRLDLLVVVGR